jgi:hypothetical protein
MFAAAVEAAPIPIPTDSELILNFDFTSEFPAPPYDTLDIAISYADATGQFISVTLYSELDGGTMFTSTGDSRSGSGAFFFSFVTNPAYDPLLDGVFSVGLSANPPLVGDTPVSLTTATAVASVTGVGSTPVVAGDVSADLVPVPEPGTLCLVAVGLAGAVRRRARSRRV